jgi:hypothetical protein
MKKTNKTNVLKGFNDTKANAVKKASATMSTFKKSLPKAQDGKTVKTYKNTPYAKESIVSKSPKGTMIYEADKKGNVSSLNTKTGTQISMDTTGYSKGKSSFPMTTSGYNFEKKTNLPRKKVIGTINNMKKEVKTGVKK